MRKYLLLFSFIFIPFLCSAQDGKESSIPQPVLKNAEFYMYSTVPDIRNTAALYYEIDPIDMLDGMTRIGGSGVKQKCYFRLAYEECDALSYLICRNAKKLNVVSPAALVKMQKIYARGKTALTLKNANGSNNFYSPDGKLYPAWDYHAAALFTLDHEGKKYEVVLDPFLSGKPLSLETWKAMFFDSETKFIITDFKENAQTDKQLIPVNKIPKGCKAHPVRAANIKGGALFNKTGKKFTP